MLWNSNNDLIVEPLETWSGDSVLPYHVNKRNTCEFALSITLRDLKKFHKSPLLQGWKTTWIPSHHICEENWYFPRIRDWHLLSSNVLPVTPTTPERRTPLTFNYLKISHFQELAPLLAIQPSQHTNNHLSEPSQHFELLGLASLPIIHLSTKTFHNGDYMS